jgi:putative glutamine amidotransferase
MRPLIGITCSRVIGGGWGSYDPGHFMDYTFNAYSEAVLSSGGAPLLIPVAQSGDSLDAILHSLGGLILSGGPDINPRAYGEAPLAGLGDIDEDLDRTELEIARRATACDLPVLGICRGIQILNVSRGGTLYQDIAGQVEHSINHVQKARKGVNTHSVRIEGGTLLHRIFNRKKIWVNGRHHQAVKDVASNLAIGARAEDGVIEAVEDPARPFTVAVQWHPEGTWKTDPHSKRLFHAFVKAASRD